jgi:hypothetical protein
VDVMDDMDAANLDEAIENQTEQHHGGRNGGRGK